MGNNSSQQVKRETLNPDPLSPPTRLKRLQRGTPVEPPPSKAPKLSMADASPGMTWKGALDVGSLENEIEDFTDDEGPVRGQCYALCVCVFFCNGAFTSCSRGSPIVLLMSM
jgi:hypothetical protein